MVKRWTIKEDIVVCKYCIENPWAYRSYFDIEGIKSRLEEVGCTPRSDGAIRQRAYAYEILQEQRRIANLPEQVLKVYQTLMSRKYNSNEYRNVKSYIVETYRPDQKTDGLEAGNNILSAAENSAQNLLGYQYAIDYHSTFPMVLQKYIDLKGVKKHTTICRRIGMKPDTFSAILRGKYKEVKKENILKICVGLELRVNEAEELLNSAGYMLSNAIMTDVVVKAFLWNRIYSVVAINTELYENNEPMLFQEYEINY